MVMIAENVVDQFNENGFVVLPRLLSEDELVPISEEVDNIISCRADYLPEQDLVFEPGSTPPRVRNAFRLTERNPFFLELARHPKIVGLGEEILGQPIRLYSSQLFAKPPEVGSLVPLHQDLAYWPFEPAELISCWIALDDTTIENGCVRFISGSHKLGLLRHIPSGVVGNSLAVEDPRMEGLIEKAVEVPRGSVVVHHCLTVHRSEPNRSAMSRRGLIFIYMSARVRVTDPSRIKGTLDFPLISAPVLQEPPGA